MRSMHARSTVIVCAAALVALTGCSGNSDGEKTSASTSTSSASSEPTYDDDYIMSQVREADKAFRAHDPNAMISEDADWVTDEYRASYNENRTEYKDKGVVVKGKLTTDSLHLAKSDPDAPGGWYVTVHNCSTTTERAYIDGEDVTRDPSNPDKLLPKGPRDNVFLDRYVTPDGGKSWQLNDTQRLTGKDATDSPCAT